MLKPRQRKTKDPCPGCFLHPTRCLCDKIPQLALSTKLTLIIHQRELKRTTNTGRLAIKALQNSTIFVRGEFDNSLNFQEIFDPEYNSILLYPSDDALELTQAHVKKLRRPLQLIVPDGNWRQASKV